MLISIMKRYHIWLFITILSFTSCHKKSSEPTLAPPVRVTVMPVETSGETKGRTYSAVVSSAETTTISFSVSGRIESLNASEGQQVSKGQVLGKVNSADYVNARNIAYAQLAEAQDGYDRLKKLHDANVLPEVKWVEMEQKLKQAKNAAEMADRTLEDAVLRAPVSGTINRKFADVGQTVVPVQPIYEIISTKALEIEVPVSESEISEFQPGQKARITIDNVDTARLSGRVKSTGISADPLTRTFSVKVELPQTGKKILPGMLANVTFEKDGKDDDVQQGILMPSGTVLLNHDNRWFVWVVKDSTAQRRFVEVDQLVAEGILVKQGLNPGDTVIIEGMQKVGSGSRVVPLIRQ